jgi:hypothetical protein
MKNIDVGLNGRVTLQNEGYYTDAVFSVNGKLGRVPLQNQW